jgi:glycosyltransferase involved in cell wall biosynthesis
MTMTGSRSMTAAQVAEAVIAAAPAERIVFVSRTPIFGGAEKHLLDLVQRMAAPGIEVTILCAEGDPFTARPEKSQGTQVVQCRKPPDLFLGWLRLFRDLRPDVVVFVHGVLSTFHCGAYVAARLSGAKTYALQHLIPPAPPPKIRGFSLGSAARRIAGYRVRYLASVKVSALLSASTICVSAAVRDGLMRQYRFKPQKTLVVHNGVKASDYQPSGSDRLDTRKRLGIRADEILIITLARLAPQKGIDILLKAARKLLDQGHHFRWIVAGEGPLRNDVADKIASSGLTGYVQLAGFQQDVRPYLQAADIFVLSSLREGLPLSILEAMASGLPCVVTNVGGNAEAVRHRHEGIVVSPGSVEELAEAIAHLLHNPDERERMSRLAQVRVREFFDIDTQMKKIGDTILGL